MLGRFVGVVLGLCLAATGFATKAPPAVSKQGPSGDGGAQGVWGSIVCNPSQIPGLTISLNGTPLTSATLLRALPHKSFPESSSAVQGILPGASNISAEFHLPPLLPGSYLLEFLHPSLLFPKYQVSIKGTGSSIIEVYLLNEYMVASSTTPLPVPLRVVPTGVPRYFPVQGGFNLFDLLRQPLVILVLVSLGIMFFLPKMQEVQMEAESQLPQEETPEHHIVDGHGSEAPESSFVEKLMRHGGN
ncbi:ER membrane protein complex subunit 7-like [Cyclospora cayetanensis]|nr:ER membrane protein complex subunit 7-like [Cyclospora cayetanensis]